MMVTIRLVLLVIAAICFILHAIGVPSKINLEGLGLFFLTLTFIVTK